MFLGHISMKWEKAIQGYLPASEGYQADNQWTTQAILLFWHFTKTMWTHHNSIVYGADAQQSAEIILWELRQQVRSLYQEYNNNPNIILPRHSSLFTARTLEQRLKHNYDNMTCWVRSVHEPKLVLAHHDRQLSEQSSRFFHHSHPNNTSMQQEDTSSQSSYSPSTQGTSNTYTTLYTTTTDDDTITDLQSTTTENSYTSFSSHASRSSGDATHIPTTIQWRDW